MEYNIDNAELTATLTAVNLDAAVIGQAPLEVAIGESARIDIGEAINYVKSGAAEIAAAVQEGTTAFDLNAEQKTAAYNQNASDKTDAFNTNAENQFDDYNANASNKLNAYNDNATAKMAAFDNNAATKTQAYNDNATAKTTAFNENAALKQAAVDDSADAAAASAATAKQYAIGVPSEPSGYSAKYWAEQTAQSLSGLQSDVADIQAVIPASATASNKLTDKSYVDTADAQFATKTDLSTRLAAKQDTLVSGTNIKTINGQSVLGSGDLTVTTSAAWGGITGTLSAQTDLQNALNAKANNADLATVATSGSYNDLSNKPTIPAAQVNSDWNATSGVAQILNKPDLSNYVTLDTDQDISGYKTFLGRLRIFYQWPELMLVDSEVQKGTVPPMVKNGMFDYVDQNQKLLAAVIPYYMTSKETQLELRCYSAQAASDTSFENVILYGGTGGQGGVGSLSVPSTWPNGTDNTKDLGKSWARWKQLYAGTTSINTSDERVKQGIEPLPDDVLDAWGDVEFYRYKFNDAVEEKGFAKARYHTGMVAQRIERVFAEHGLNAFDYGLLCYDEWEAVEEEKSESGEIVRPARAAGNRYSLRYEECLCMEAAYQRRRADRIEARLAALEARL